MYTHIHYTAYMSPYMFRRNHLSNATCLTRVFFKSGELRSESW